MTQDRLKLRYLQDWGPASLEVLNWDLHQIERAIGASTAAMAPIINPILDHGMLLGLLDDDHPQYLHLPGRGGGQVLQSLGINENTFSISGFTGQIGDFFRILDSVGHTAFSISKENYGGGYPASGIRVCGGDADVVTDIHKVLWMQSNDDLSDAVRIGMYNITGSPSNSDMYLYARNYYLYDLGDSDAKLAATLVAGGMGFGTSTWNYKGRVSIDAWNSIDTPLLDLRMSNSLWGNLIFRIQGHATSQNQNLAEFHSNSALKSYIDKDGVWCGPVGAGPGGVSLPDHDHVTAGQGGLLASYAKLSRGDTFTAAITLENETLLKSLGAAPSTPSGGYLAVYADGASGSEVLKTKDSSGVVKQLASLAAAETFSNKTLDTTCQARAHVGELGFMIVDDYDTSKKLMITPENLPTWTTRYWRVADTSGYVVIDGAVQNLSWKYMAANCRYYMSSAGPGGWLDVTDTSKMLRWDLTSLPTSTTRVIQPPTVNSRLIGVVGQVDNKTGQTAAIGKTTILSAPSGKYRLSAYVETTAFIVTPGTIVVYGYFYTETAENSPLLCSLSYTGVGEWEEGSKVFYHTGTNPISFSTTYSGDATYKVYLTLERLQ